VTTGGRRATTQGFPSSKTTGIILGLLKRRLRPKLCGFAAILQICGLAGKIQGNHAWALKKVFEAKTPPTRACRGFFRIGKSEKSDKRAIAISRVSYLQDSNSRSEEIGSAAATR
jgi:hypothetical protein